MAYKPTFGVELYRAVVFPLNSDGTYPIPLTGLVYEGLQFEGSRIFTITPAENREIINYGDGRVRDTIYLPPNTSVKGQLTVGYDHQEINAALTGAKQFSEGTTRFMLPMSTDKQGTEPIVSLLLMQMAHDTAKLKRWRYYLVPRAQCLPLPASFNENATEMVYQITFAPSTVTFWNDPLTEVTHGCTEAAYLDGAAQDRPNVVMFHGDGVYDVAFALPTDKPAKSTSVIKIYNLSTGAEVTAGVTKTTTSITFVAPPSYPFEVVYEY